MKSISLITRCCVALVLALPMFWKSAPGQEAREAIEIPLDAPSPAVQWQPSPDGVGEYFVFNNAGRGVGFSWRGRVLVGTPLGLLAAPTKNQWEIVPPLYGRSVRAVGAAGGLFWLEGFEKGVLGLDENLAIKKRLPGVKSYCIAAGLDGFWCLDKLIYMPGRPGRMAHTALVVYDASGQEKRLFQPGKKLPAGQIYWATADDRAIWLWMENYQGILPNDTPRISNRSLVRVERESGATTVFNNVTINRAAVINLAERILWLTRASGPPSTPSDKSQWTVHQFDKKNLQVSVVGTIEVAHISALGADEEHLWVFGTEPRVYSLRDFRPLTIEDAGALPEGALAFAYGRFGAGAAWWEIAEAGGTRLWLDDGRSALLEIADDGTTYQRDLAALGDFKIKFPTTETDAQSEVLYLRLQNSLLRVRGGQITMQKRTVGERQGYWGLLAASGEQVWILPDQDGDLTALTPDLSRSQKIDLKQLTAFETYHTAALGRWLFFWKSDSGDLLRADGHIGRCETITSWRRLFTQPQSDASSQRVSQARHLHSTFAAGGKLVLQFYPDNGRREAPVLVYLYDPQRDAWQKQEEPNGLIRPVTTARGVFGISEKRDDNVLWQWREDKWHRLKKLPQPVTAGSRPAFIGTQKFLYAPTPLGIYRVAWSQLEED